MRILLSNVIRSFVYKLSVDLKNHPMVLAFEAAKGLADLGKLKQVEIKLSEGLKLLKDYSDGFEADTKMPTTYGQKAKKVVQKSNAAKDYIELAIEVTQQGRDAEINDEIDKALKELGSIKNL